MFQHDRALLEGHVEEAKISKKVYINTGLQAIRFQGKESAKKNLKIGPKNRLRPICQK